MSSTAATVEHARPRLVWSKCSKCLKKINRKEFLANDFICDECAEKGETYPLASTGTCPHGSPSAKTCVSCSPSWVRSAK